MTKKEKIKITPQMKEGLEVRVEKYHKKLVGDVVTNRIDAQKDIQLKKYAQAHLTLIQIEDLVRKITSTRKVNQMLVVYYMAFGRQVAKIYKKYKGKFRGREREIVRKNRVLRGLNKNVLDEIKEKIIKFNLFFR